MKSEYDLKVIAGHVNSVGSLTRCSHPGVSIYHTTGSQNYEIIFPEDFNVIAVTTAPLSPNQQVAVYVPSPTAGMPVNSARLGVQTPIGTNAVGDFDFIAVGY